jgi:ubiquinone biosynthesis protein UbiJ
MNGHDSGPDTMTLRLNKTKALWSTIATVAGGLGILLAGVNWYVAHTFDSLVTEAAKDPHSVLRMTIDDLAEEQFTELIQVVVDDDIEVLERDMARLERRLERLEER